jgi:hypothetical protein
MLRHLKNIRFFKLSLHFSVTGIQIVKALDYVTFRYRMPTGRDGDLFRTRDLECTKDHYQVTMQGRLVRAGSTDLLARPLEDLEYSGWLDIVSWAGHFRLEFESGRRVGGVQS